MKRKMNFRLLAGVLGLLLLCTACKGQETEPTKPSQTEATQETTTVEETTPEETEPETAAPTIEEVRAAAIANPNQPMMYFYDRHNEYVTFTESMDIYSTDWIYYNDILLFTNFPTNPDSIAYSEFRDVFRNGWNAYADAAASKIGYEVKLTMNDGTQRIATLLKPSDTQSIFDYVEVYLYDDVNRAYGEWYSHLEDAAMNENTFISGIKLTTGKWIDLVGYVDLTMFTYQSEADFDSETGRYIGGNYNTMHVTRKGQEFLQIDPEHPVIPDAHEIKPVFELSNGGDAYAMSSASSYDSMVTFMTGDTIKLASEEEMQSLYICWNNKYVQPWTLIADGEEIACGANGYLHEYVEFPKAVKEVTLRMDADYMKICKLFAYSPGNRPAKVQVWNEPCKEADVLLLSTHADDEHIFFGGIIPYYAGELELSVQVAYYTNYWNGANVREHEKLDGLWTVGVKNYPINGDFDDIYATSLEGAKSVYDYEKTIDFVVDIIRRFRPIVLVGQDLKGEYGHGGHMITASAITEAIEFANDENRSPESAKQYGIYNVPKTYLHLYEQNSLDLDCQRPMNHFGGKTVLDVAKEGYLQHQSQQWCWFYVSDDYEYSCGRFGLYRTLVGEDVHKDDILENCITYKQLAEEKAAEEASIAESIEASIAESVAASEEASREEEAHSIEQSLQDEIASKEQAEKDQQKAGATNKVLLVVGIIIGVLTLIIVALLIYRSYIMKQSAKKHRKKRREE